MGPNRAHLDGVFDSRNNNKWKENGTLNSENINWIELTYSIEIICIVLDGIDLVAIFSWILLILDSVSFYDFFLKVVRQADRQKSRQIFYYSTCHQRKYPSIFTDCFFLLSWRLSLDIRSGIWTFIISIFNCSKIPIQDFFEMFLFRSCSKMKFISSDFRPFSRWKLEKKYFIKVSLFWCSPIPMWIRIPLHNFILICRCQWLKPQRCIRISFGESDFFFNLFVWCAISYRTGFIQPSNV